MDKNKQAEIAAIIDLDGAKVLGYSRRLTLADVAPATNSRGKHVANVALTSEGVNADPLSFCMADHNIEGEVYIEMDVTSDGFEEVLRNSSFRLIVLAMDPISEDEGIDECASCEGEGSPYDSLAENVVNLFDGPDFEIVNPSAYIISFKDRPDQRIEAEVVLYGADTTDFSKDGQMVASFRNSEIVGFVRETV